MFDAVRAHLSDFIGKRPHALPLAVVAIAWLGGQAVILSQSPAIQVFPDSLEYMAGAERILRGGGLFDPVRPPVFPLLLALLNGVFGSAWAEALRLIQGGLFALLGVELYALAWLLGRRRWVAAAAAALTLVNLYLLDWERTVLTEVATLALVAGLFLLFVRQAESDRVWNLLALVATALLLTFVHVLELAVAAVVLGGLVWLRPGARALLAAGSVAAVIVLYAVGNGLATGHYTVSCTGQANLFVKVIEYDLVGSTNGAEYPSLKLLATDYVENPIGPPLFFAALHPSFAKDCSAEVLPFVAGVVLARPADFLVGGLRDTAKEWLAPPAAYAPIAGGASVTAGLLAFSRALYGYYLVLPVALIWLAVRGRLWSGRRPRALGVVVAAILVGLLLGGFGSSGEFFRLRVPLDPEALLIVLLAASDAGAPALARLRYRSATVPVTEPATATVPEAERVADPAEVQRRPRRRPPASVPGT